MISLPNPTEKLKKSLKTEQSLKVEIPLAKKTFAKVDYEVFGEKALENKVKTLKLELEIVKKKYELGMINTPLPNHFELLLQILEQTSIASPFLK